MFHILVVDDDKNTRKLIEAVLRRENFTVSTSENGKDALEKLDGEHIDLVVLDVMMPEMDGYEFTKTLRESENDIPILMVSAKQLPTDKHKGFLVGTDDYITKPFHNAELLSRISSNLRRSARFKENSYSVGDIKVLFDKYKILKNGVELGITPTEFNIIKILIQNKGCVVKREVIYDRIWDMHGNYVEYNTLTVAVSRIKAKLGTYGEKHQSYIETIRNVGYRWIDKI